MDLARTRFMLLERHDTTYKKIREKRNTYFSDLNM